jgi:hypothetical protein
MARGSEGKFERRFANTTAPPIQSPLFVVAANRIESAECPPFAAGGAWIISPERHLKIRKALMRDVHRRKLRLKFRLFGLYIRKVSLNLQYVGLLARSQIGGYFSNLFLNPRHHKSP